MNISTRHTAAPPLRLFSPLRLSGVNSFCMETWQIVADTLSEICQLLRVKGAKKNVTSSFMCYLPHSLSSPPLYLSSFQWLLPLSPLDPSSLSSSPAVFLYLTSVLLLLTLLPPAVRLNSSSSFCACQSSCGQNRTATKVPLAVSIIAALKTDRDRDVQYVQLPLTFCQDMQRSSVYFRAAINNYLQNYCRILKAHKSFSQWHLKVSLAWCL